jgi:TrpR-related protein YerC/YecD
MLVAKMLSEQIVYNKIVEETGASTATISRVNRSYLYGAGGYKRALEAIAEDEE